MPVFSNLLIRNIEKEAERTEEYLSAILLAMQPYKNIHPESNFLKKISEKQLSYIKEELFTNNIKERIKEAQYYLQPEKLKFFDSKGKIVFSTDGKDIGEINTKPYFLDQVVKGKKFSKIFKKNSKSAENRTLETDVAEIYIIFVTG